MAIDTNIVQLLGAGSGVDIKSLATSLVEAEKLPRQNLIQSKIDKSQAKISGYAAMLAAIDGLKASFESLNDTNEIGASRISTLGTVVSATVTGTPSTGTHSIEVNALARAQTTVSPAFSGPSDAINGGGQIDLTITLDPLGSNVTSTVTVPEGEDSLEGIAAAINAADLGLDAQVIDLGVPDAYGNQYSLVVTGPTGSSGAFSISSSDFSALSVVPGFEAQDASFSYNGISLVRETNSITDLVEGIQLDLSQVNTGSPVVVAIVEDASSVKEKLQSIVDSYNQVVNDFSILTGPDSEDPEDIYSGSLRGNSTARSVLSKIREVLFSESETPGSVLSNLRDLGVSVDRSGVLSFDSGIFDEVAADNLTDIREVLAGRSVVDGQTSLGLASRMVSTLTSLMSTTGPILTQSSSTETQVQRYEDELLDLESRMEDLQTRYLKEFTAMENLVGQMNSLRESLKVQFENLSAMYSNK